jgi:hypothetical protein
VGNLKEEVRSLKAAVKNLAKFRDPSDSKLRTSDFEESRHARERGADAGHKA